MKKTIKFFGIIFAIISNANLFAQCSLSSSPNQTFCCGGSVISLSVALNSTLCTCGGVTYNWMPATGLSNPNIANPTATVNSSIVYTVCATAYKNHGCFTFCCQTCTTISITANNLCCRTTGINELNNNAINITVYPNPGKTNLTIEIKEPLQNAYLNMYDVSGKLVWKKENFMGKDKFDINVSTFPRGIYIIKVNENGKDVYANKVILE